MVPFDPDGLLDDTTSAHARSVTRRDPSTVVVDETWLTARADRRTSDGRRIVLADVRWYLDGRDGRTAYEAGHLPGAIWVDLDRHLAAHGLAATEGRHPLPEPDAFAMSMTALGIDDDTVVVAYDDSGGLTAGRLVVMVRMLGRDAVLLDGGLRTWSGPLDGGGVEPEVAGTFTATPWPAERIADTDTAAATAADPERGVVLDARAPERFRGEVAVADPRPGHIPGARNAPWSSVLTADGRLRPAAVLHDHFAMLGVTDGASTIVSCGSGVSACLDLIALEIAGFGAGRLYPASWSGWSADPDRPAALGA
jgi:thiosulfate/3-mercaptopyruvate sulfurtransferase